MLSLVVLVICLLVANFSIFLRTSGLFMSSPCKLFNLRIGAPDAISKRSNNSGKVVGGFSCTCFSTRSFMNASKGAAPSAPSLRSLVTAKISCISVSVGLVFVKSWLSNISLKTRVPSSVV